MEKKTIVITGANKGIGFEISRELASKGHHIIISGRNQLSLIESVEKLRSEYENVESLLMDVGDDNSVGNAFIMLTNRDIKIDVLINNAAISYNEDRSLLMMNFDILMNTINVNSYGPARVIRTFSRIIKNGGRIVNLSSEGGSMTEPVGGWSPAYCVSKTFLNSLTRHFANELSARNISVNAVTPGWVRTEMGGTRAPRSKEKGAQTPVWLALEAPQDLTGKFFKDKEVIPW